VADDAFEREIESRVGELGFELVELELAGSKTRPILRLRIDREGSMPGHGVSLEDCARVSRGVEGYLDGRDDLSERYVLEVSSPGIERPLVKRRDFERFAGREVAIKTAHPVGELGKRVEGVLRGVSAEDRIQLEVSGQTVEISRAEIKKAHLVFRWDGEQK
jgi:ribosome maturation factor RimP